MKQILKYLLPFIFFIYGCTSRQASSERVAEKPLSFNEKKIEFESGIKNRSLSFPIPSGTKLESIIIDSVHKIVKIKLSRAFSYQPFRIKNVGQIYNSVKDFWLPDFKDYQFIIGTIGFPVEDLIPNFYRKAPYSLDLKRIPHRIVRPKSVTENVSKPYIPINGLFNKNIVIAPSHGWYYNAKTDRWEWQRPRLFQSVEDLLANSFCIPYLIPMLENAGAVVFDPRERDVQTHEVIVDNDDKKDVSEGYYQEENINKENKWEEGKHKGFARGIVPYKVDYNPFIKGTYKIIRSDTLATSKISWNPDIPESGDYGVYISYHASKENIDDAHYIVYHSGIKTEFRVNQQIGGNTWQYLGRFKFSKGFHPDSNKVVLLNDSKETDKLVSADAVRFGGGMGVISRGGRTSGRPKFIEASRYYLQFAGMPDSLVYNFNNDKDDYNDDKQDRSKYVNYLNGSSVNDKKGEGLGIPIDISLALHTDAGVSHKNKIIGTLALYGDKGEHSENDFPNDVSRLANRDLADIVQSEITNEIGKKYDPNWTRRQLMNEQPANDAYPQQYSEVYRPNVPSVLIELLSHQNFTDMKFANDPQFRFDASRAIYIGFLKFLSVQDNFKYVVQPLPVNSFAAKLDEKGDAVLDWKPTMDKLEPTAKPTGYIVYTRINDGDFDNGQLAEDTSIEIKHLKPGVIYSFKVTAVNSGGESFPSEILSVCSSENTEQPVLIINGFTRVSGPGIVNSANYQGFLNMPDAGVPYKYDIAFTGTQFNFNPKNGWKSNDNSGWGDSHADYEAKVIAGNTFDFPYIHGRSIKAAGYPFVSASVQSVIEGSVNLSDYKFIDLILGEQKTTHWQTEIEDSLKGLKYESFPKNLQKLLGEYCKTGGNLFISGSYVASDLFKYMPHDRSNIQFANEVLKFKWDSGNASLAGNIFSSDSTFLPKMFPFRFNTFFNDKVYAVKAPDAISNTKSSKTILRYSENSFGAGIAYKDNYGVIVFGFPFETIEGQKNRDEIMKAVFKYFSH